jgi:NAD(P)-dependent dehydrogenase (short-subunit alcohol dehydrogenase family)
MSRIFLTGSSEGLGLMAGRLLSEQGHDVVLDARNTVRAQDAQHALRGADVVIGDVSTIAGARSVAEQANALGRFDAVIHNVAVGYREPRRVETSDGLPQVFATNVLAPYILTALMRRPQRLIYLSSGLHRSTTAQLDDVFWRKRRWDGAEAYSETKLYDTMLAFAIARRWPDVFSNALEPGWVPTKMGGSEAPDDINQAHLTQVWLAVSDDALVTGQYFYHKQWLAPNSQAEDSNLQDQLIAVCERSTQLALSN